MTIITCPNCKNDNSFSSSTFEEVCKFCGLSLVKFEKEITLDDETITKVKQEMEKEESAVMTEKKVKKIKEEVVKYRELRDDLAQQILGFANTLSEDNKIVRRVLGRAYFLAHQNKE